MHESYQFMLVYCLGVFNIVYDVCVNPSFSMLFSWEGNSHYIARG